MPAPTHHQPPANTTTVRTQDGTTTLFSHRFHEHYHCSQGAYFETQHKFILPLQLQQWHPHLLQNTHFTLNILDMCFGMGYNLASIIEAIAPLPCSTHIQAVDISPDAMTFALQDPTFQQLYTPSTIAILQSLSTHHRYHHHPHHYPLTIECFLCDARQFFTPKHTAKYHIILFDPFSPQRCPELWSEEFLQLVTSSLAPGGRWLSYATAAAYRSTLCKYGLHIFSVPAPAATRAQNTPSPMPSPSSAPLWSMGTVAIKPPLCVLCDLNPEAYDGVLQQLSEQEHEHLQTRAAIPYQDPSLNATRDTILARRDRQQQRSTLPSATAWRKKWQRSSSPASSTTAPSMDSKHDEDRA